MKDKEKDLGANQSERIVGISFSPPDARRRFPRRIFTDQPLPFDQIVPTVQSLVDGSTIGRNSNNFLSKITAKAQKNGSFNRVIKTMLDYPGQESENGFGILSDDLERFRPDKSLLESDQLREWFGKLFIFGNDARIAISIRAYVDQGWASRESKRYREVVEEQVDTFLRTLRGLQIDDLSLYLRFADLFGQHCDLLRKSMDETKKHAFSPYLLGVTDNLTYGAIAETVEVEGSFIGKILQEDKITWERLRADWGPKQIRDVLCILPFFNSLTTTTEVVAALEENLISSKTKRSIEADGKTNKTNPELMWGITNLVDLGNWGDNLLRRLEKGYPHLVKELKDSSEFAGLPAPRRYLPSAAISVLTFIGQSLGEEQLLEVVKTQDLLVHVLTSKMKERREKWENVTMSWVATLLALKASYPDLSPLIDEIIDQSKNINPLYKETVLNKKPGKIWLTKDGRIRLTNSETCLSSAFPIYVSSACSLEDNPKDPETSAPVVVIDSAKEKEEKITPSEFVVVPLFGEVVVATDSTAIDNYIDRMFSKKALDEDGLLDECLGKFVPRWCGIPPSTRLQQEILYPSRVNICDLLFREAVDLGIDGIYVNGNDIVFILNQRIVSGEDHQLKPTGIRGSLDGGGQLSICGMGEFFVGEPKNLYLANLALHCATQQPRYTLASCEKRPKDKEIQSSIRAGIADWNRGNRGDLPRICPDGNCNIGMRVPGFPNEVVLVAESTR